MSDEKGHPQRMPDPGTPFPIVGSSGGITLERTGSTLTVTATDVSGTPSLPLNMGTPERAAAIHEFLTSSNNNAIPELEWGYRLDANGNLTGNYNALLQLSCTLESGGPINPGHYGPLVSLSKNSTNKLDITLLGSADQQQHSGTFDVGTAGQSLLHGFYHAWLSNGGAVGDFIAGLGCMAASNSGSWSLAFNGEAISLALNAVP